MQLVDEYLKTLNINNSDNLVVAVSFGPDSMALLNIIKTSFPENSIICAHVNHNHRKESDDEEVKLQKYCLDNGIIFETYKIKEYTNDKFTEEEARKKRYEFFDKIVNKYNSRYLFTAHHGDDLVETVLMRLTRGSSLSGYRGIQAISKRNNYSLVRPLLFVTKDELLDYCMQNNINYAVDKSNNDDTYTRNRYRKYVLPVLKEENKNVHKQFLKFSTVLQEYDEYFNNLTEKLYNKIVKDNVVDISLLLDNEDIIVKRVLMKYLFNQYRDKISNINGAHLLSIMKLVNSNKANASLCLPNKKRLIKSYNKLYFNSDVSYDNYCYIFDEYVSLPNGYAISKQENLDDTSNFMTALKLEDVTLPLYVRNKIDGDKIEVLGLNGSKKINDIFITEKIPKESRISYPILVDSMGKILWLPGLKKSKYDHSKKENYDIILKYYKEDNYDTKK